ncbi:hypothetical protein GBA52_004048 [Prunus armeniaca]|nr:hypothetical protein GBA52_004048 [Prunus armeniaca]
MVVESLLTVATEVILMKLTDGAFHEISLAFGYKDELGKLNESLSILQDFLGNAAEKAQDGGKAAEVWVKKLKDIADEADDVFEELNYERLRGEVEPHDGMGKQILDLFSTSNPFFSLQNMAHRIKKINDSMEELKKDAAFVGLIAIAKKKDATPQRIREDRETNAFIGKDEIIIGRKDAVSDIVTTLTNSNMNQENLSVMAIAGMPGLGKTTLAKSVYNEGAIDVYFNQKLWVCVSDTFNVNSILAAMLELLSGKVATTSQQALLTGLREKLSGKRYFLVLDDVWNEESEKWERLMSCLSKLNSAPGSKIIVTTRSGIVASLTETLPRPELKLLSTDECWSILKHAACSDGSSERIGREIAKKCEGLPLMAQVLGGILRSKKTSAEWSEVKDNRIWDLPKTEDRIMSVLKLSFDNLESPALKQCFSYCLAFKKDAVMERDDLIQLWMAQGFLHPSEKSNLEMEDIGNEYFDILFQRSLFQDARLDDDGIVFQCKMHDLIHDLAERVSETGSMMRYFQKYTDVATPIIERIPEGSSGKLRSLFSNAEALPGNMLPWFKALRVLKLYETYIEELPSSIEELKRLRYLDISFTNIKRLPNSIGKLYNLQTLRARCCKLEEFPKDVQNLINLRHVYCDEGIKFPAGVLGRLTLLRTLPYEEYEVKGREIEELAALNQLKGKLIICNLEDVRNEDEASKAKLEEKKKVRHFLFEWTKNKSTTNNNEEDVLEGLQPHSELERLEIQYFMGTKFPSWMIKLRNLKQIELKGCNRCEKVPTLGHLPHLTVVWIKGMGNLKCIGEEIYGNGVFPALKELHIHDCKELIELMEAPEQVMVFPRLEKLEMLRCPKLRKAPSRLPCPKELEIQSNMDMEHMEIRCEKLKIRCAKSTCIAHYIFGYCASLRKLAVFFCPSLQSIPDLHSFTSLRELSIKYCERLERLVSSGPVSVVELLTIKGCSGLQSIPDLNLFPFLRELTIESCERLESLVSSEPVSVVELLTIKCCSGLQSIPDLNLFPSLCKLSIESCERLKNLVSSGPVSVVELLTIKGCSGLQSIPDLNLFPSLCKLSIEYCERLESLVNSGSVSVVELLTIKGCSGLQSIPDLNLFPSLRELSIESYKRLGSLVSSGPVSVVELLTIKGCSGLQSIPDLNLFPSLCKLSIKSCERLENLVSSGPVSVVELLTIEGCSGLQSISNLNLFPSLRELSIESCERLESLVSSGPVSVVELLTIKGCSGLQSIPDLNLFPSLCKLSIESCERLKNLVSSGSVSVVELLTIEGCSGLQSIPDLNLFPFLRELSIESCERLESLVSSGPVSVVELLTIEGCSGLQFIPDLNLFPSLRKLSIESCERLESLVSSGPVSVVNLLTIKGCSSLQFIPNLNLFPSLRKLSIEFCKRLKSLVSSGPVSVVMFKIRNAPNLESLASLDNLTSLFELVIVNCGKLKYLPTGLHCCASLKTLELGSFWEELDSFPYCHLETGSSQLQTLILTGWPKLKSLPQQIQDFTSLTYLQIHKFDGVEALEDWLGNLTSLRRLGISSCKNLKCLPSVEAMQRLTKLETLIIWECPLLKERCTKDSGPEWPKISHIRNISIVCPDSRQIDSMRTMNS